MQKRDYCWHRQNCLWLCQEFAGCRKVWFYMKIQKRDGRVVAYEEEKITSAKTEMF